MLGVAVLAFMPGLAAAAPDPPDPGQTSQETVVSNGTEYRYLRYTPTSYSPRRAAPLLVMVHGCQTTAEQEMRLTLYNQLAEREGFVVLYPDVDAHGRTQPGPANQCWKFPYPPSWSRDNSDAAAIADMTRAVMAESAIDTERVYLVGLSAGGLMAAIDAAAYPDLFAAVGIVASSAYADWPCFTTGVGIPVTTSAQLAFDQMGPRARVVPIIAIGSDADQAFPATCTDKALEQGLRTNNLVVGGSQDGPIALTPAAVREEQKPGGHAYTVSTYRDPAGCLIGERWIIHGMPHAWPGGTTDEKYAGYTDTRAPSGAEGTWAFLRRYRKSDTAMPCAEAPVAAHLKPALRLRVRPRRVRAGRRVTYRFKVTASEGGRRRPIGGALVRFARRTVPTNRRGRARLRLRFSAPRIRRARAIKSGYRLGRAQVRITRGR
jgi:poly(hydroxyalkanoate) depolymerase family esterase